MATVTLRLSPRRAHVRTARLVASAMARRCGVAEELLDDVRLAVGEACARAVRLHERDAVDVPVTLELADGDTFSVVVADSSLPGVGGAAAEPVVSLVGAAGTAVYVPAGAGAALPRTGTGALAGQPGPAGKAGHSSQASQASQPGQSGKAGQPGQAGQLDPPGQPDQAGRSGQTALAAAAVRAWSAEPIRVHPVATDADGDGEPLDGRWQEPERLGLAILEGVVDDLRVERGEYGTRVHMSWPVSKAP